MILNDLYKSTLIQPTIIGCNQLFVVSGYASATFAHRHLNDGNNFSLSLIIGMPSKKSDHLGYLSLYKKFSNRFNGYYLHGSPPVHCKLYAWYQNENAIVGYSGSANYSQYGFFESNQVNNLIDTDPKSIKCFYNKLLDRCIPIKDYAIDTVIQQPIYSSIDSSLAPGEIEWEIPNKRVRISFLSRYGELPERSGLNWGQRPEYKREANQAYLSLKKDARKEGFLPKTALTFTLITDDNQSFDCVVAQQGRKSIQSTFDNSELGKYIRNRLGIPLGEMVTRNHLENYGRNDYTIEKINEETFLFDFSV
jgi:hypothetical protein